MFNLKKNKLNLKVENYDGSCIVEKNLNSTKIVHN